MDFIAYPIIIHRRTAVLVLIVKMAKWCGVFSEILWVAGCLTYWKKTKATGIQPLHTALVPKYRHLFYIDIQ